MAAPLRLPNTATHSDLSASQKLDAGQFAALAVHDELKLPADKAAFKRQYELGLRLARSRLSRRGVGKEIPSDLTQASMDVMQELCLRLRQAEKRARATVPVGPMSVPQLLARIEMLVALDRSAALDPDKPDTPGAEHETDPRQLHVKSPGAHLLATVKELSARLLTTTPGDFGHEAHPWTNARIAAVVTEAMHRMAGYTYTALVNICLSFARSVDRLPCEPYDESHHEAAELARHRRTSVVMSPHMRAVVVAACRDGLAELKAEAEADGKHTRNLPFVEAAIKVLPLLLDAPDEKPYALARTLLEAGGLFTDQEIRRGLAAAVRHPVYERVCKRIDRGDQWPH